MKLYGNSIVANSSSVVHSMVRNEEFTTTHLLYGDLIYPLCLPTFNFVLLTVYRPLVDHSLHT